jgi:septation ring formation regulator EzrA
MNDRQIQIVQEKLSILGAMIESAESTSQRNLATVHLRGVPQIIREIEDHLQVDSGKDLSKTDEEALRCAEALYAGAKIGFFTAQESIEYLGDSIEALDEVLERTNRVKKKIENIKKTILQYLKKLGRESFFSLPDSEKGRSSIDLSV